MILAAHQPDLLPYSGFWYKMAKADIFDLKIYDQLVDKGYQRRVRMRGSWATVPLVGKAPVMPIVDARIDPEVAGPHLARQILGRYRNARYWRQRGTTILDMVTDIHTDRLWQFNVELIVGVRDMLGIATPLGIGLRQEAKGNAGVISALQAFAERPTYLSGTGGRAYMGDCSEYAEAGIDVLFSRHVPVTGDSILSVIFDYANPLDVVLAEHDDGRDGEHDPRHELQAAGTARARAR
jgi:WbqC-like protein family